MGFDGLISSLDAAALAEAAAALLEMLEGGDGRTSSSPDPAGDAAMGDGLPRQSADRLAMSETMDADAAEFSHLAAQRSGREAERKKEPSGWSLPRQGEAERSEVSSDAAVGDGLPRQSADWLAMTETMDTAAPLPPAAKPSASGFDAEGKKEPSGRSLPRQGEAEQSEAVSDMETVSEFFRRDSRRYDSGFGE